MFLLQPMGCQIKSPAPDVGCFLLSCWLEVSQRSCPHTTIQTGIIAMACPPELNGKTLLLKKPYLLVIGHGVHRHGWLVQATDNGWRIQEVAGPRYDFINHLGSVSHRLYGWRMTWASDYIAWKWLFASIIIFLSKIPYDYLGFHLLSQMTSTFCKQSLWFSWNN